MTLLFAAGVSHDSIAALSHLVQSLHVKETRMLLTSLQGDSSADVTEDVNILSTLQASGSDMSSASSVDGLVLTVTSTSDDTRRRRQFEEERLYRKLKEMLEGEDINGLVAVVKFLVLCGREDLLPSLL